MSDNHALDALRAAAEPHLDYWDPEAGVASQLLAQHLLMHNTPAKQALTIADAMTHQARAGSPLSDGPISAAYQAPLDSLLSCNPGPRRSVQVWSIAFAAARLPQSATPAGFARALTTQAQAAGLALPTDLLAGAPPTRATLMHIRVTPFEKACIQKAAARHNTEGDVSAYIRAAIDAFGRN